MMIVAVDHIYDAEMDSDFNFDRKLCKDCMIAKTDYVREVITP